MQSLKASFKKLSGTDIRKKYASKPAYVTKEFQAYALDLAIRLDDYGNKGIYIRLAKTTPRYLLEQAYLFTVDYTNAKNRGKIFLWKLKKLKDEAKKQGKPYKLELPDHAESDEEETSDPAPDDQKKLFD